MIYLDLEWNAGHNRAKPPEILQIGAVRVSDTTGKIEDSFCVFIHPQIHNHLCKAAEELPEINASLASAVTFPEAIQSFRDWRGEDRRIMTWGTEDYIVLKRNLAHWKLPLKPPKPFYDVQAVFSELMGLYSSAALRLAVRYLSIPQDRCFHNALHDAYYTASVCSQIPSSLQTSYPFPSPKSKKPKKKARQAKVGKSSPPMRYGPFENREAALRNRGCRGADCLVCGIRQRTDAWFTADADTYYAKISCPKHGPHLRRLTVWQDPQGCFWGEGFTQQLSDEGKTLLLEAKKGAEFRCKASEKKKKKRFWYQMAAASKKKS